MDAIDLRDKVALVTGGASGIGAATVRAFLDAGAAVVVADIDPAGKEFADDLAKNGASVVFVEVDVASADDCERMVHTVLDHFGRLDFAHNNAAWEASGRAMLWDYTEEHWDRTFDVCAKGVWLGMKAEFPALRDSGGAIVNTASCAALRIDPGAGAYNAAKAAVIAMTRQAGKEMGRHGVRANAIAPGIIDTPLLRRSLAPEHREAVVRTVPVGRIGQPEDMARIVVWLCSPLASYINGATILADGGLI
jgi:NAD(P)-dependent dehydrogenase (short-subunit alcohol dehydrogenase family)